jgi:hypothetical protein
MTSRAVSDLVGGWQERPGEIFWIEDGAYVADIAKRGYRAAVLADLRVHHTGGKYYTESIPEKDRFWARYHAGRRRRQRAKAILVRVPFVRRLNARYGWFVAPS